MPTYQPPQINEASAAGERRRAARYDHNNNQAYDRDYGARDWNALSEDDDCGGVDNDSLPSFDDDQHEDEGWKAILVQRDRARVQYVPQREADRDEASSAAFFQ